VHHLDEAEVRVRAEDQEALLEADVGQLHREVPLPHMLHHVPQGGGPKR
jgi:hypothetical protein